MIRLKMKSLQSMGISLFFACRIFAIQLEITVYDAQMSTPLPGVNLVIQDSLVITTDANGIGKVSLPPGRYEIVASHIGFERDCREALLNHAPVSLQIFLSPVALEMSEVVQTARQEKTRPGAMNLPIIAMKHFPSPTSDPIRFVKVLPGVSSGNDFSNTYHVRGGNFTENLVYINGVELEFPFQIRRSLSETLSLVNPDMAGRIDFYAGAFPVRYGNKLSSLLEVDYRIPEQRLGGLVRISLLRQDVMVEGRRGAWSYISGWRRADLSRLTRGLQTTGEYEPRFRDWQGLFTWKVRQRDRISLYSAISNSRFSLDPAEVLLRYNCTDLPVKRGCDAFRGRAEGQERFFYTTRLLGVRWRQVRSNTVRTFFASLLSQKENGDTDLSYRVHWIPKDPRMNTRQLSSAAIYALKQSKDRLDLRRTEVGIEARRNTDRQSWDFGGGLRITDLNGASSSFEEVGSAGWKYLLEDQQHRTDRRTTDGYFYIQQTWKTRGKTVVSGLRFTRFGVAGENLILPRLALSFRIAPKGTFSLAVGRYAQPPIYREFLGSDTSRASGLRSQKAVQLSADLEYASSSFLNLEAGIYYRRLTDLISYTANDLRIEYSGRNDARGYAYGLNARLQWMIAHLEGILSYGYLTTRENIAADGRGFIPRPTDQRHTLSAYLEDRMNLRPFAFLLASRFHVRMLYGSGFPHTPKIASDDRDVLVDGLRNSRRDKGYFRFDVGTTQTVKIWGQEVDIRQEVINLFDQYNVGGYTYLPTPVGTPIELRNTLGRRIYNLSLSTHFRRD